MSTEPVSDERLRQAVRDVLAEELDQDSDQSRATRRQVLGSIAAGGVLGGLAGAGSAGAATGGENTSAMVGALAGPPYKVADPGLFSGPNSAKSSVSRDVGQIFLANDTGQRWYDNGSAWDHLPSGNSYVVTSAAEANDVLTQFGNSNEPFALSFASGEYDETDFQETIDLPRIDDTGFSIDMTGVRLIIGSDVAMPDPLVRLPDPGAGNGSSDGRVSVDFRGPRLIDGSVLSRANAGEVAQFWGLVNSHVWMPKVKGPWSAVVRKEARGGSGHQNFLRAYATGMDRLFVVGEQSDNTQDRSFFFGQAAQIYETAVDCYDARDNYFHVQPENKDSSSPNEVRGYYFQGDCGRNHVDLVHFLPDTPIDNRGHVILGPRVVEQHAAISKSRLGEFHLAGGHESTLVAAGPMVGPASAGFETSAGVAHRNFGETQIDAGTSDGNTEYVQTPGRVGPIGGPALVASAVIDTDDVSSATVKFGIFSGGGSVDTTTYAGLVYEPGTSSDFIYRFVDGGTVQTETISSQTPTGNDRVTVGFSDTSQAGQECYAHAGPEGAGNRNRPLIGSSTDSVTNFSHPRFRLDITVNGTPGSAQEVGILRDLQVVNFES